MRENYSWLLQFLSQDIVWVASIRSAPACIMKLPDVANLSEFPAQSISSETWFTHSQVNMFRNQVLVMRSPEHQLLLRLRYQEFKSSSTSYPQLLNKLELSPCPVQCAFWCLGRLRRSSSLASAEHHKRSLDRSSLDACHKSLGKG